VGTWGITDGSALEVLEFLSWATDDSHDDVPRSANARSPPGPSSTLTQPLVRIPMRDELTINRKRRP
jgi:hypothetical protein